MRRLLQHKATSNNNRHLLPLDGSGKLSLNHQLLRLPQVPALDGPDHSAKAVPKDAQAETEGNCHRVGSAPECSSERGSHCGGRE